MNSQSTVQNRGSDKSRPARAVFLLAGLALFSGCETTESHVVSAPPPDVPVVVQQQPAATVVAGGAQLPPGTIVVTQAPPTPQQEVVQARPSSEHVWVAGYWSWRNQRYEWMPGHWEIPPRSSAVWIAPRWERLTDGSYRFYEGYWQ